MEPLEYRSVIKFLNMQGKSPSVIFEEMFSVYQEECPSYETVKYWVRKFKSDFLSIHDSPREGRPNFVVTEDSVCQVKTLVLEDRRVTVIQLAAIIKMSVGSIETILHDHLHMSKVSARWVPRLLTPNQKEQRADSCKELIKLESEDTRFFLSNRDHGWNMGSPFWSWNEIIINAMENALLSYTKEAKGGTFVSHPKSYYAQGLLKVKERWQKCVDMQGDYVEK